MSDLVERLRNWYRETGAPSYKDAADEIERLKGQNLRQKAELSEEIEHLRTALERNTQEIHRYKHIDRGHHCGWRVIAEAMIARSREALQEGE